MDEEVGHVEQDGQEDEAEGPGHEVLEEVEEALGGVTEHLPQLADGEDADVEHDEQADKLDSDGPGQKGA